MPGTLTPGQMFDHELNGLKGWPSPYALDKRVQALSADEGIVAGMCVHIDPTTKLGKRGCINGYMPLFAFQGQNEFDVNGDVGNIISGFMNTLVATGAYELETTEFVTDTYNVNEWLKVSNVADTTRGKLLKTTLTAIGVQIVGIVSEAGPTINANGKYTIKFWPVYCPARSLA